MKPIPLVVAPCGLNTSNCTIRWKESVKMLFNSTFSVKIVSGKLVCRPVNEMNLRRGHSDD